jgi:2-iminobutanoate/2-iminopropanoate deaminase
MRIAITVPGAPVPAGPYSHAVRTGDLVFVSGQVPRAADGSYEPVDVGTETRRTLRNLETIAVAAGARLADAVKITAYLADGSYFDDFNRAYAEFFPADPPARTTVVAGLRQVKVELDAVLYVGP